MKIIDISQRIQPDMLVYPGDPHFGTRLVSSFKQGDMCEVSELTIGSHCGTHVDAPLHMIPGGETVESMPLVNFIGPCRVLTMSAAVINEKMLQEANIKPGERILLRTDPEGKALRSGRFNPSVLLVGIDSPTVENMELCDGEVHRTLMEAGVAIVEGLCLQAADKERYILSALPLSLTGENGAPCRAVLIDEEA